MGDDDLVRAYKSQLPFATGHDRNKILRKLHSLGGGEEIDKSTTTQRAGKSKQKFQEYREMTPEQRATPKGKRIVKNIKSKSSVDLRKRVSRKMAKSLSDTGLINKKVAKYPLRGAAKKLFKKIPVVGGIMAGLSVAGGADAAEAVMDMTPMFGGDLGYDPSVEDPSSQEYKNKIMRGNFDVISPDLYRGNQ